MVTGMAMRLWKQVIFQTILALSLLAAAGCTGRGVTVQRQAALRELPGSETVYVLPFTATLVPPSVGETVFDSFVDIMNETRPIPGVTSYVILKNGLGGIGQDRLRRLVYCTADVWGYRENTGCCSTQLKVSARISLYRGGISDPLLTITIPHERFVANDRVDLGTERALLARTLAQEMSLLLSRELRQPHP